LAAVGTSAAAFLDAWARLRGEACGRVQESPCEGPAEGARFGTVPVSDKTEDIASERGHALEASVAEDATLEDAEPDLDLIDPRGVQRRVDEAEAMPVLPVEPRPARITTVVVQVEVVPDDVDASALVALGERVHEGQECARVAVPHDATEDLPRANVEGREERARPTTPILELVADDAMMTDVDGVTARQRLHRLLVDAYDDGVLGRVLVKTADPRNLRSKLRVGRMEPVADAVRAPAAGFEDAPDGTAAHPLATARVQGVGDRLVGPHVAKDDTVVRGPLARERHDLAPRLKRYAWRPAAPWRIKKRFDARASFPAGSPLAHHAVAASDEPSDRR